MPVYTTSLAPTNGSDAAFRAWGSWISACLAAAGWVQTADAGQIDWTTVLAPAGNNTVQGYEMWRMNDALQGAAPIFMKLEYGAGNPSAATPGLWHEWGAGSDGAGALTGLTSGRAQAYMTSTSGTGYVWVISADVNRFVLAACTNAASAALGLYVMVERTHDGGGADTADGLLLAYSTINGGSGHVQQYWPHGGTSPGTEATLGVLAPTFGSGTDGTTTAVYPLLMSKGPYLDPPLGLLGCFLANFTPGTPVTLSVYGALHTYLPTSSTYASVARSATASATAFLVRYE